MTESEKKILKDKVVIDTGPLIDYLSDVGVCDKIESEIIDNDEVSLIIVSPITITEIFYVLCRNKNEKFANKKINELKKSVKVEFELKIRELAGKYKCFRSISLADCYTIATAKLNQTTAIFKKEFELLNEIKKNPLDVNIYFID